MKKLFSIFLFSVLLITANAKETNPLKGINFTENKGQVSDQNYKPRPDVLFSGNNGNMTFHIKNNGISYQLNKIESQKKVNRDKDFEIESAKYTTYRVDLFWKNCNSDFKIVTDKSIQGENNYYLETCPNGLHGVKSYEGVRLKNIYNKIDIHYYEKDGDLKYDYIVSAGANYKLIQVEVNGAEIKILKDGSLSLKTPIGVINEGKPVVYQNGKMLEAFWKVENNVISFDIKGCDKTSEMIIDPPIRVWGTYYGGTSADQAEACAVDASGNVYMAGYTTSTSGTLIATSGSYQSTLGGMNDAFLVKFDQNGVRLWATYYGGSGDDVARFCSINLSGEIYVNGYSNTTTSTVIATPGAHQTVLSGANDAFLVKFNSSGTRIWGTYYGGTGNDYSTSTVSDALGNVYLCGMTASSFNIATVTHQTSLGGGNDGYLVKFNSSGVRQWGTYYGGSVTDYAKQCVVDAANDVYVAGYTTSSSNISTAGSHQVTNGGGLSDGFLVKFNSSGVRQWGTYYGGSGADYGESCCIDISGNIYFAGYTDSSSGIATAGAQQTSFGGNNDAFLVKFNASGVRQWGTYYGGPNNEYDGDCTSDNAGNVYLLAYTNSTSNIATVGSYQITLGGSYDAFLIKFNSSGSRQWGTYYGGSTTEYIGNSVTDGYNIYFCGETSSTTNIASFPTHQNSLAGSSDAFLVKFNTCAPNMPGPISGNASSCVGITNYYTILNVSGATSYTWTFPAGWTGSYTTTAAGGTPGSSGSISVTATNSCGISPPRTISVTVYPSPTISVSDGTVCSGQSYTINPSGASTYSYSSGSAVISPTTTTSYTIGGYSSMGCVSDTSVVITITVTPSPTITTVSSATMICIGQTASLTANGGNTYLWNPGGSGTVIAVSPTVTTNYTVTGTDSLGCQSNDTISLYVSACTSISESQNLNSISVYPNPNNGLLNLVLQSIPENCHIEIYNELGQLVLSKKIELNSCVIDLTRLSSGIFQLVILSDKTTILTRKIVKE